MKMIFGMSLTLALALTAMSGSAMAGEYKCASQGLSAYLVFDDGPGGLDHLRLEYQGKSYALVVFDASSGQIEVTDANTPDGRFEYDGLELALQLTGADQTTFVLDAKRPNDQTKKLTGTVAITSPSGETQSLPLRCTKL